VPTTIAYDPARYWITSIHSGALQLEYNGHDNVGNVTSIRDGARGMNLTFGYDALDRLTSVMVLIQASTRTTSTAIDRIRTTVPPINTIQHPRLMSQYGVPFTYDNNGNLKSAPGRSYAYTPENWLQTGRGRQRRTRL
jgi:YD repeat-containing protein